MGHIQDTTITTSAASSTTRTKVEKWFQEHYLSFETYTKYGFSIDEWEEILFKIYPSEEKKFLRELTGTFGLETINAKILSRSIIYFLNKKPERKDRAVIKRTKIDSSKQAEIQKKLVPVYPDDALCFEHPTSPWVSIQFRTSFTNSDITNDSVWEEIVFNPNTFFQNFSLEDNKGVKRITVELVDQFYTKLENTIQRCVTATQLSNKLSGSKKGSAGTGNPFDFIINTASFVNMRIRFGYTDDIRNPDDFINTIDNEGYKKRINSKKPVLRTPWILFQILSIKQKYSDEGLRVSIQAISSSNSFFNKAKMIKKFALIKGKPINVLKDISDSLSAVSKKIGVGSKGGVSFYPFAAKQDDYYSNVDKYSQPPVSQEMIEVQLGDKPKVDKDGKLIEEYKTVKEILDEVIEKVPPLKILPDGSLKEIWDDEQSDGGERFSNYQFVIEETDTGDTKVRFYYTNPDSFFMNKEEIFLRTYFWRESSKTVLKDIDIQTETDFAQMNMPIFTVSEKEKKIKIIYNDCGEEKTGIYDLGASGVSDISSVLEAEDFDFSFVSQAINIGDEGSEINPAKLVTQKFLQNINNSIFRGTIEMIGDPFFLFDSVLQPYQYLIKLVVMRPDISMTSKYSEDGESSPISYISGYYTITNIKHKIGLDGFSTTLEIMRWPSLFKTSTPGT